MARRFAPMALRMPISRVRSATETNMMFMMPMPPTNSDRPVMNKPTAAIVPATRWKLLIKVSCWLMEKSSSSPGGTRRIFRSAPRSSSFASSRRSGAMAFTWMMNDGLLQKPPMSCLTGMRMKLSRLNSPIKLPCTASVPTTSKLYGPSRIVSPSGDWPWKRFVTTFAPITHTGRAPSDSSAEKKRPSAMLIPPVKRYCSVVPTTNALLERRFL